MNAKSIWWALWFCEDEVQEKQSLGILVNNSYRLDITKVNGLCNSLTDTLRSTYYGCQWESWGQRVRTDKWLFSV